VFVIATKNRLILPSLKICYVTSNTIPRLTNLDHNFAESGSLAKFVTVMRLYKPLGQKLNSILAVRRTCSPRDTLPYALSSIVSWRERLCLSCVISSISLSSETLAEALSRTIEFRGLRFTTVIPIVLCALRNNFAS